MEFTEIGLSIEGRLARLCLNRPEKVNALSERMIAELRLALEEIAQSKARAVLLTASGRHFCAGHLLDEMVDRSVPEYAAIFQNCTGMMRALQDLPQPVVAAVRGVATAAGCQLVAACDLALAAKNARFATPGVRIGLFCGTPAVPLVRAVGRKRALEMLLTGRWVSAEEAADWGLVNQVAPPDEVEERAGELALRIAEASPVTLGMGKRTFYRQVDRPEGEAYNLAAEAMALNLAAEDAQEGIKAFIEKRDPVWRGR